MAPPEMTRPPLADTVPVTRCRPQVPNITTPPVKVALVFTSHGDAPCTLPSQIFSPLGSAMSGVAEPSARPAAVGRGLGAATAAHSVCCCGVLGRVSLGAFAAAGCVGGTAVGT